METQERGFYYLHTNGSLIYKRFRPESDSPFVKKVWEVGLSEGKIERGDLWIVLIEAAALGATKTRIDELVKEWGATDEDAHEFAKRAKLLLQKDGNQWMAAFNDFENIQESQCGFGATCFEAFVELAKQGALY